LRDHPQLDSMGSRYEEGLRAGSRRTLRSNKGSSYPAASKQRGTPRIYRRFCSERIKVLGQLSSLFRQTTTFRPEILSKDVDRSLYANGWHSLSGLCSRLAAGTELPCDS